MALAPDNLQTLREALYARSLGELDELLQRVERLPSTVDEAQRRFQATAQAMDESGDRFRLAVTAFTEQARVELTEYLQRRSADIAARTVEEQRAALQEAARAAFRFEAADRASELASSLAAATKEFRRTTTSRLVEHGLTAALASLMTASAVLYIVR